MSKQMDEILDSLEPELQSNLERTDWLLLQIWREAKAFRIPDSVIEQSMRDRVLVISSKITLRP